MKAVKLAVAVLILMALAQVGFAADLQAGWYANVYMASIYTYGEYGPQLCCNGAFSIPCGDYAPFTVTDEPYQMPDTRSVGVTADVYGVGHDSSLWMPISFGIATGTEIAFVNVSWATNYDPNQMVLEFWREHNDGEWELGWCQPLPGSQVGETQVFFDTAIEGDYAFRVNVVPEPHGFAAVFVGLAAVSALRRRGR